MDEIDRQIDFLNEKLSMLRDQIPDTPLDVEKKAMEIGLIEEQLAELYEQKGSESVPDRKDDNDGLTEEIRAITDELMEIEIRMLKAELNGDDSEKVKLQLSANVLKGRRQELIDEVKNNSAKQPEQSTLEQRVAALEKEVSDLKALVYRLLTE